MKPYTLSFVALVALLSAACSGSPTAPDAFNYIPPDQQWKPGPSPFADLPPAPPFVPPTPAPSVPPAVVVAPPTNVVTPTTPGQVPVGTQPYPWTPPSYTPGPNPGGVMPGGPSGPPAPACAIDSPFGPWSAWTIVSVVGSSEHPHCSMTTFRRTRTQACTGKVETEEKTECV